MMLVAHCDLTHHWKLLQSRVLARPLRHAESVRVGVAPDGTAQGWGSVRGACVRGACTPGDYAQLGCAWRCQAASPQPRARRDVRGLHGLEKPGGESVFTGASLKLAACVSEVSSSAIGTAQPPFFRSAPSPSPVLGKGRLRSVAMDRRRESWI